ncbi:Basal body P-ring protein [Oligella ureolytica]|uniref:Flagellar P-ring protein n=2 Tax=Oligella ureolytica TaxID=90244 RepID=A0A378XHE0_9BURK|nr:Basal body P-ring protein [Oligella ureolytica]SUA56040.1 Basal body P-ring protein [Oligella ureolytica]
MKLGKLKKKGLKMLVVLALLPVLPQVHVMAEPLRDLASIQGVRDNQLIGYGLVVGLDGTGDQVRQSPFTQQSLTNMLAQLGVTVPAGVNMQVKNVATVMVTATLPSFAQPGQSIDVNVSSMGNAKSLRGGTLLMTPLKGADNQVYALAQGNIVVGGAGAEAGGSKVQLNQLNGGMISGGALVERTVPTRLGKDGMILLEMHDTDFGTTENAVAAINRVMGAGAAIALNGRVIQVRGPNSELAQTSFLARLQGIDVKRAAARAKVIINARTGTVVMNQTVTIDQAAVAFGSLSVMIEQGFDVNQPDTPFGGGQTVVTPNTQIQLEQQKGKLQVVNRSIRLTDVVRALNALGASPQDLISILQALKSAGALRAELEII